MNATIPLDIKICGLSTPDAVDAAIGGGASHVGFIFFERSPRHVEIVAARALADRARGRAKTVAVTVDADDAALDAIVAGVAPDILQLHGSESPARVAEVKARYGLPVMKALSVRDASDLAAAADYAGIADRLLFDAKAPAGSALPGGNGVAFDWTLLASALDDGAGYMLSGGINSGNVAQALDLTGARGIDVSSGVESAPGVKDIRLIETFLATVRARRRAGDSTPARAGSFT